MDQINVKNVNAVDVADDLLKTEVTPSRKQNEFPVLEEWEMVLAGGGEGIPCW